MEQSIIIGGFVLLIIVGFILFFILINSTTKLHKELDEIKEDAINAKTNNEISSAYEKLKVISKKLWHNSFEVKFVEIRTILETKKKSLENEQYVYVIYDPLYEKVVCVHSEDNMECDICKPIYDERDNYFLESVKCLVKK